MGSLDEALPPGADWIGRKFADIDRRLRELAAARSIAATLGGDPGADLADLRDAVGTLPAPGQVARRDQANTFAAAQRFDVSLLLGPSGNVLVAFGSGSPEGAVTAAVGSHYHRSDGGASTTLYVKESGAGNTGWVAYGAGGGGSSDHATLTNVTANQHHNQAHAIGGGDHTGTLDHGALGGLTDDDHTQYVTKALVDAKGDLVAASAADTVARLAVGSNGQLLKADSSQSTGLVWGTLAHSSTTGIGADDHHTQAHADSDHSGSGKVAVFNGLLGCSLADPAQATTSGAPTSGRLEMVRVRIPKATAVTNIIVHVINAGVTLTAGQNLAGIYSISGTTATKQRETADQSGTWNSTGQKTMAVTSYTPTADADVLLVLLSVGTTPPQFARPTATATTNMGVSGSSLRAATGATSQTSLPSTIDLTTITASSNTYLVGLS